MKTHKLRRILSLLLAVVMMVNVLPISSMGAGQGTITVNGTTYRVLGYDTNNYLTLTDVTFLTGTYGDFGSSDTLTDNDMVHVSVDFEISNKAQLNNASGFGPGGGNVTAVTVFRKEVTTIENVVVETTDWARFTDASGASGYWRFVNDGTSTYFEVIVTSTRNQSDISGSISLEGTVDATTWSDSDVTNETITLKFDTGEVTVTYVNPGTLSMSKSSSGDASYDATTKSYIQEWTVTLTASSTGYIDIKGFTDTSDVDYELYGTIVAEIDGTTYNYSSFADLEYALINGGYLSDGAVVTLTYSTAYSMTDIAKYLETSYSSSISNTAKVTYNDTDKSSTGYLNATLPSATKTCSSYDSSTNTLIYTIKLSWDQFTGNATTDSTYITDVKDKMTMANISETSYSENISIPDLTSGKWTWDASSSSWTYEYSYSPTDEQLVYNTSYINTFSATIGDVPVEVQASSGWFYYDYITKGGSVITADDEIEWTVTFTVPYDNFLLSGLTIQDTASSNMTYVSGSESATLTTVANSSTSNLTVTTVGGTSFTFSSNEGITTLSKGDTIVLTYRMSVDDASKAATYTNTAKPVFTVDGFTEPPSQSETKTVEVEEPDNDDDILTKAADGYGYVEYLEYTLTINATNLSSSDTVTISEQLSIPNSFNNQTNYLYSAWQEYVSANGVDYAEAFAFNSVSITGGTLADGYSIAADGSFTFTVTDISGTSVKIVYQIVFTDALKPYVQTAYADAIASSVSDPGFFVSNTATAYVNGEVKNTSEATDGTYADFVPDVYVEKVGTYKENGSSVSISNYEYVNDLGDTIVYTLTINPDGKTLNNGEALTITDTLGSGLALWSENAVKNGANIDGYTYVSGYEKGNYYVDTWTDPSNPVEYVYSYNSVEATEISNVVAIIATDFTFTAKVTWGTFTDTYKRLLERGTDYTVSYDYDSHVITFTVPDSTPITIIYYCEVLYSAGAYPNGELANSVEISGSGTPLDISEVTYVVSYKQTSSITGNEVTLSVDKIDSVSLDSIYGATFTLVSVDENGNETGDKAQLTVDKGNSSFNIKYDTIYKLEEISTPDGYTADDTVYYVYVKSQYEPAVTSINGVNITVFAKGDAGVTEAKKANIEVAEGATLTITTTDGSLSADNFESDYNIDVTVTNSQSATVSYPGTFTGISGTHYWSVNLTGLSEGTYNVTSGSDVVILVVVSDGAITVNKNSVGTYIHGANDTDYLNATIQVKNTPSNTLTINKYATGGSTQLPGATFTLKANTSLESVTANQAFTLSSDNYSLSFTTTDTAIEFYGLPDGSYTLTETVAPGGYKVADPVTFTVADGKIDGSGTKTITVEDAVDATQPQTTSVTVTKSWVDDNDRDGIRPDSVTVTLTGSDGNTYTANLSATDGWTYTWTDLPKEAGGVEITYTVDEDTVPTGYAKSVNGFEITNTHAIETTSVIVTKKWEDDSDRDKLRPTEVTVSLLADGTIVDTVSVTEANGWEYTWDNLPKNDNGFEIDYTVAEVDANGVSTAPSGYTGRVNGFEITNTHEIYRTEVKVTKSWVGDDNNLSDRPSEITVVLTKNGSDSTQTITLNSGNNWTNSFKNLPVNDENGDPIAYGVKEVTVNGYRSDITGDADNGYTITNTYEPPLVTISVSGAKTWVDGGLTHDNATEITLTLYRTTADNPTDSDWDKVSATVSWSGNTYTYSNLDKYDLSTGKTYTYKVVESDLSDYTSESKQTSTGYDFTNTIKQDGVVISGTKTWVDPTGTTHPDITIELYQDGTKIDDVTLSNGTTTYEFTGLDKYDLTDGHEYKYTVKEAAVSGYTSEQNGNDFTNTIAQETISVSGTKTWIDPAGTTHPDITIELYQDGTKIDDVTLSNGTTTYEFTGLDKYDLTDGHAYEYTVKEAAVSGYTSEQDGNNFTNTIEQDVVDVTGAKTWIDPTGTTHPDITIELYRDGTKIDDVTLSNGTTTYEFTGLDKYDLTDGHEYKYTVKEAAVSGYTSEQNGNDFTNTIAQETISVTGTKTWIDPTGTTHPDITIELYRDGTKIDDVTLPNGTTTYEFTGLDKYDLTDGHAYEYAVKEVAVSGYTSEQNGNDFTNTQITTEVTVSKVWDDAENQDGLREDYTVTLYKTVNGAETKVESQTLPANTLTYTWTELPTYETVNGTQYEVSYTVEETGVPSGYTASDPVGDVATGFEITNSHTPYTTEVSVTKVWSDAGDYDGVRPDSITVTLTGSDGNTYTAELTKDNNWEYTFTDLPVYWNEGTEIGYTLEEVEVDGYTSVITGDAGSGFTVTNSNTPHVEPTQAYTNIGVTKVWNDDDDADGVRPASVTIALYRDGVATGRTITISEANNWTASFTHLPVYRGTAAYSYTVAELDVPAEYTATVTGGNGSFTITNTHMPVVEIEEPVEATNTDEEEDGEAAEASETESNPKTGIALSILPMAIAALAVALAKRR